MKRLRTIGKIGLTILLLNVLVLMGAGYYVSTHQETLIREFENWFAAHNRGTLTFDKVRINTFQHFPTVSFTLENLCLMDSIPSRDSYQVLEVNEAHALLSLKDLLQKEIQFKALILEGGTFIRVADTTAFEEEISPLPDTMPNTSPQAFDRWIKEGKLKVLIRDFSIFVSNRKTNKRYTGLIDGITAYVSPQSDYFDAAFDLDLRVDEMGFNLANGTYFNGAQVSGLCNMKIDRNLRYIQVPSFELKIDDQSFFTQAQINFADSTTFRFDLSNPHTLYSPTVALLSEHIQRRLTPYELAHPIDARATITGSFTPGSNPWVNVWFNTTENEALVADTLRFSDVAFSGHVANRIYEDPDLAACEDRRNARLFFDSLHVNYKGAQVEVLNSSITSTPEINTDIDLHLTAQGKPEQLNEILYNQNFLFKGGQFDFQGDFAGDVSHLEELLNATQSNLELSKTELLYRPTNLLVPIDKVSLTIDNRNALVNTLQVPLPSGHAVNLDGQVNNFMSLIFRNAAPQVVSEVNLHSEKLNLDDFLGIVNALNQEPEKQTSSQDQLYTTLQDIYERFDPHLGIAIDSFQYNTFAAKNLRTRVRFNAGDELAFEDTGFEYDKSKVQVDGTVKLSPPDEQRSLDVDLELNCEGASTVFNRVFGNQKFLFTDGDFQFEGQLEGKVENLTQILFAAQGYLACKDIKIRYSPQGIIFPIDDIELVISGNDAHLLKFIVPLISGDHLKIQGQLENFATLLRPSAPGLKGPVRASMNIFAQKIDYQDFVDIFETFDQGQKTAQADNEAMVEVIKGVSTEFNPELSLHVESFIYNDFEAKDATAKIRFEDIAGVHLEEAGFTYANGKVQLDAFMDLSHPEQIPFSAGLETEPLSIATFMETFDYFGQPSLKKASKVEGNIAVASELEILIKKETGFDPSTLKGFVYFELEEGRLKDFSPIQNIANKIFRAERFEDIRFARVSDTLFINEKIVTIPQIEIQSNAFDFFVEGILGYEKNTNIWVSIPLRNLRRRNLARIPEKNGYWASGKKIFVQAKDDGTGKLKYKLRLNNKTRYKEQGILPQYKIDKKREREARKLRRKQKMITPKSSSLLSPTY